MVGASVIWIHLAVLIAMVGQGTRMNPRIALGGGETLVVVSPCERVSSSDHGGFTAVEEGQL